MWLTVHDIVLDRIDIPYIHVNFNQFRRIKNEQSIRFLPIHPELMRLGFRKYVESITALGYERLFPDIYSPYTKSPLGDRYYDEMKPFFVQANFTTHQIRHFFGNELKQKGVTVEVRADMLGHGGKTETDERYCDPVILALQLEEILKLPVSTAHLVEQPIQLLPWVTAKLVAPWARPPKTKSSDQAQAGLVK